METHLLDGAIFAALVAVVFGFAGWTRRYVHKQDMIIDRQNTRIAKLEGGLKEHGNRLDSGRRKLREHEAVDRQVAENHTRVVSRLSALEALMKAQNGRLLSLEGKIDRLAGTWGIIFFICLTCIHKMSYIEVLCQRSPCMRTAGTRTRTGARGHRKTPTSSKSSFV